MSAPSGAVFLSYASQDVEPASRIRDALQAAGIEVWFDQAELRGGDTWDAAIRKQIKSCALFIPIISRATNARHEGYFRLEWKLAVDRSHLMSSGKAFLLPVAIDDAGDEHVPDKFREVQWTRLPDGHAPPAFVERIARLLSPTSDAAYASSAGPTPRIASSAQSAAGMRQRWKPVWLVALAVLGMAFVVLLITRPWASKPGTPSPSTAARPEVVAPPAPVFAPPPHSIAVLPFVNVSGEREQEYFADGLSEELLNSLARIPTLQVAGRTSSFYFKGEHTDLAAIARKLNVGAVLEGTVQRSGQTLRISVRLIDTVSGFQLWAQPYDRNLSNLLKLQTEIAGKVAEALKVTWLADQRARIEVGGTSNPDAFDAYLRALKGHNEAQDGSSEQRAIEAYTEAIRLDPHYALAFAGRSVARVVYAWDYATRSAVEESYAKGEADARQAVVLAPDLPESHVALAGFFESGGSLDFQRANEEYSRAVALGPGNAQVLRRYALFAVWMGHTEAGIAAANRAVALDPLNPLAHRSRALSLFFTRRYAEAVEANRQRRNIAPDQPEAEAHLGFAYYMLGDWEHARASCEVKPDYWDSRACLAITYAKLGRKADSAAALAAVQREGITVAYQLVEIYAQLGEKGKALDALETAMAQRDGGLAWLKTDPLIDPLRGEPRFQAIERRLQFPE